MKASYNWLQRYFAHTLPTPHEVADLIYEHSFEIEGMEKVGEDTVLELDVLSNRSHDALGHLGVAKDLAVMLDREVLHPRTAKDSQYTPDPSLKTNDLLEIKVHDSKLVPRVMKRIVADVKVGPSPEWLVTLLAAMGQRSINNVVDITNFVMYETSQPVHTFDYDKISGSARKLMEVRLSKKGEPLTMLDGKAINLDDESLVWADTEKALDLAGIKGGNSSGVDNKTTRLVLSVCNFEPINIRKTRQRHKIVTDASRRFEHFLSSELPAFAIERLSALLANYAGAKVAVDTIDIYPEPQIKAVAKLDTSEFNSLIGVNLSDSEIEGILNRMKRADYAWEKQGGEYMITVPVERLDVREKHEIIEEVARYYGYKKVQSRLAPTDDFTPKVHKGFYYNSLIKNLLVEQGFSELYNYVMSGEGELEFENSQVEGMSYLRNSMVPTITRNLVLNIKNADLLGVDQVLLFELNKVAYIAGEHWALGLGVKNAKGWKGAKERAALEEVIKQLEDKLGTKGEWQISETDAGAIAEVNVEKMIGSLSTPSSYGDVLKASGMGKKFKPFSQYPFILRDVAVWTPTGTTKEAVEKIVKSEGGEWLVNTYLFDTFTKDDKTSYAFRLVFQSMERTLTDQDANAVHACVVKALGQAGYTVR